MYEYIFTFVTVSVNESLTIIGFEPKDPTIMILNKPALDFKWIRILKDENLKKQLLVAIDHNRKNDINTIIKEVKKEIKSRIDLFINTISTFENIKKCEAIYCFAIAPKNDRWDIVGITTHEFFNHGIKIVKNFNRENSEIFISIKKLSKEYNKNIKEEIQKEVFKYIDLQKKITLKNHG